MLKIVEKTEKDFQNKYFVCAPMINALTDHSSDEIEVNVETPALPLSIILYVDDMTEKELIRYHNTYCEYMIDEIPVFENFDRLTASEIAEKLLDIDCYIFKIA